MNFNYYLPVNLIFGNGSVSKVGNIVGKYGKKALIVTGGNSTKKSGLLDKVTALLKKENIDTVLFDKVTQNPLTTTANSAAKTAVDEKCDVVVAIGGGSVMDCAKAAAFIALNDGDINDYIFAKSFLASTINIAFAP